MGLLYGRAGRLTTQNGGFRHGQMTFLARQAFAHQFDMSPDDMDMHGVYDDSHNIAKEEEHMVDGRMRRLLGPGPPRAVKRPSRFPQ